MYLSFLSNAANSHIILEACFFDVNKIFYLNNVFLGQYNFFNYKSMTVLSRFLVSCNFFFSNQSWYDVNERVRWYGIRKFAVIFQNSSSVKNSFTFCKGNINNVDLIFFFFLSKIYKMRREIELSPFKIKIIAGIDGIQSFYTY